MPLAGCCGTLHWWPVTDDNWATVLIFTPDIDGFRRLFGTFVFAEEYARAGAACEIIDH